MTAEVAPIKEWRGQEAGAFSLMRTVLGKFQADPALCRLATYSRPERLGRRRWPFLLVDLVGRRDLSETSDVITRLEKILAAMEADKQPA